MAEKDVLSQEEIDALLMAKDLEIKQEPLSIVKHREYRVSLPNPTLMAYRYRCCRAGH